MVLPLIVKSGAVQLARDCCLFTLIFRVLGMLLDLFSCLLVCVWGLFGLHFMCF